MAGRAANKDNAVGEIRPNRCRRLARFVIIRSVNNPQPFVPAIRPNQIVAPSREIYSAMGAANIYAMLEDFYRALADSAIRDLFPADMVQASRKSADFFIGLLGGPPLYQQRYGSPQMRARHLSSPITYAARQVWLDCFAAVLAHAEEKYAFPPEHLPGFRQFLDGFSEWMVNTP